MPRTRPDLAEVLRRFGDRYLAQRGAVVTSAQRHVIRQVLACRTQTLGGHVRVCTECGHSDISYNSCRNRHCPKCQGTAQARWLDQRTRDVLPVDYYHVVFTLPSELRPLALGNPRVVYDILLRASAETLIEIAADPKHLGAQIGFLSILHTWGQRLELHPHVHCVVPGGGLSIDGARWVECRPGFFLPVKVLGRVFRGKFLAQLRQANTEGKLRFADDAADLVVPTNFEAWLGPCYRKEWVVYAKPPFAGPEVLLRYLARYTHRIAISNSRIQKIEGDHVTFTWKDYAHAARVRRTPMAALEFTRRFLLHVLPRGFVRIRYFGLLANRAKAGLIRRCRALIAQERGIQPAPSDTTLPAPGPASAALCPACRQGYMIRTAIRVPPFALPGPAPPALALPASLPCA